MKHLLVMAFAICLDMRNLLSILLIGFVLASCGEEKTVEGEKTVQERAKVSTADQDMRSFESNLEQYKNIGGVYPSTSQGLEAFLKKPTDSPRPRRWIQTLKDEEALLDPWDTKYKYQYPGSKDPSRPEIISAGPDKSFGGDDDQSNQD
jgi:general secretion pathway protein G